MKKEEKEEEYNRPDSCVSSSEQNFADLQYGRRKVENYNRRLEDFNIIRIIGVGTWGKVYLAVLNGKAVALKVIKKV